MNVDRIRKIVEEHFNARAKQYDEECNKRREYLSAIDNLILNVLKKEKCRKFKILDVGCGTGTRTEMICSKLPGSEVSGCDLSTEMLKIAKRKNFKELKRADMSSLPFKDKSFDVLFCLFNAIGYIGSKKQRVKAFREFNRVLIPDGLLFIDFMNMWHFGENLLFKRSIFTAVLIYLKSIFPDPRNRGNMYFKMQLNESQNTVKSFAHGFSSTEVKSLLSKGNFIGNRLIIGYDSGKIKEKAFQGQIFHIARKRKEM